MKKWLALAAVVLEFFAADGLAAGKPIGNFNGKPDDLRPASVPASARINPYRGQIQYTWQVKDATGKDHHVSLRISVYDRSVTNGFCGTSFSPERCSFHFGAELVRNKLYCPQKISKDFRSHLEFRATNFTREELTPCDGDAGDPKYHKQLRDYHYAEFVEFNYTDYKNLFDHTYSVRAGNVLITAEVAFTDGRLLSPQKLVEDVLAMLGTKPVVVEEKSAAAQEENFDPQVAVLPAYGTVAPDVGLIPASELLPARITLTRGKPGAPVTFTLTTAGRGELRGGGARGRNLTLKADTQGKAEVYFHYLPGKEVLGAPLSHEIAVRSGDKTRRAKINVGLGLAFDRVRAVSGQSYENNTYAFTLRVKSVFHPKLNVSDYLYRAHESGIWEGKRAGIEIYTQWINRPDGVEHDKYYIGTTNIIGTGIDNNVLTANTGPMYELTGFRYPAAILNSPGNHVYRINGRVAAMTAAGDRIDFADEKMIQPEAMVVLSLAEKDRLYQALACALEPQDNLQYLMLETAKHLPVYGQAVDQFTSAASILCGFTKGDYEKSFYDLGTVLGGEYLKYLGKPDVTRKLTEKQKKALKWAQGKYDALDEYAKSEKRKETVARTKELIWQDPDDHAPPSASDSPAASKDSSTPDLSKQVKELEKSIDDLGSALKGLFR